jgi:hypothetical protein
LADAEHLEWRQFASLDELCQSDLHRHESALLVARSDELPTPSLLRLAISLDPSRVLKPCVRSFGLLVASSANRLSCQIGKVQAIPWLPAPTTPVLSIAPRSFSTPKSAESPGCTDSSEDLLKAIARRERIGLLSLLLHGREDALAGDRFLICGRADSSDSVEEVPPLLRPSCEVAGRCFRTDLGRDRIVPARDIDCEVVFAQSCDSLRLGSRVLSGDFQVWTSFLDGPAYAYIGTPGRAPGKAELNDQVAEVLQSGGTLGEAVVAANRPEMRGPNDGFFFLVGFPWLRPMSNDFVTDRPLPLRDSRQFETHGPLDGRRDIPSGLEAPRSRERTEVWTERSAASLATSVRREDFDFGEYFARHSEVHDIVVHDRPCPYCSGHTWRVECSAPIFPSTWVITACGVCGDIEYLPAELKLARVQVVAPSQWAGGARVEVQAIASDLPKGAHIYSGHIALARPDYVGAAVAPPSATMRLVDSVYSARFVATVDRAPSVSSRTVQVIFEGTFGLAVAARRVMLCQQLSDP